MSTRPRRDKPRTLREWKELHGVTDEELAKRITARGVPIIRSAINHITCGRRKCSLKLALALVEETGLPIDAFAGTPSVAA